MMLVFQIILTVQVLQDSNLHPSLMKICRLILDDLQCYVLARFEAIALHNLPKSTVSKNTQDTISICSQGKKKEKRLC